MRTRIRCELPIRALQHSIHVATLYYTLQHNTTRCNTVEHVETYLPMRTRSKSVACRFEHLWSTA